MKKARDAADIDGVLSEREGTLSWAVGVLVVERDAFEACGVGSWTERKVGGQLMSLGVELAMVGVCVGGETTCEDTETMRAAPMMAFDAGNSLGKEREAWEEAVRYA